MQEKKRLSIITGSLWAVSFVVWALSVIFDSGDDLGHLSLLLGMGAVAATVNHGSRVNTLLLVHLTALYNKDKLTPEGAELISKAVPPPRHAEPHPEPGRRFGDLVDGSSSDGDSARTKDDA